MFSKNFIQLILLFATIFVLTISGYGLFIWFVVTIMKGGAAFGLLFVAVVAGVASFFNPCAFPLLPAFLAQHYTTKEKEGKKKERKRKRGRKKRGKRRERKGEKEKEKRKKLLSI